VAPKGRPGSAEAHKNKHRYYEHVPVDQANLPKQVGKPPRVVFPEAERRQLVERPIPPAIRKAIVEDNNVMAQALKDYPPQSEKERAALNQGYASARAMLTKWQRDLLAGVPDARIVELPGADLYMFISNEADVIRELRAFAATLPK